MRVVEKEKIFYVIFIFPDVYAIKGGFMPVNRDVVINVIRDAARRRAEQEVLRDARIKQDGFSAATQTNISAH